MNVRDAADCSLDYEGNKSFAGLFYVISRIYAIPEKKLPAKSKIVMVEAAYALFSMGMLRYVDKPKDVDFFNLI